jgi:hypothetical protein
MRNNRAGIAETQETLIAAVNAALEMGDWACVSHLTADLYGLVVQAGDTVFAELVQDLHWIANDALTYPLEVGVLLAP